MSEVVLLPWVGWDSIGSPEEKPEPLKNSEHHEVRRLERHCCLVVKASHRVTISAALPPAANAQVVRRLPTRGCYWQQLSNGPS